ncbi:hypothetical protein [Streptomyces sp. NBC_01429]|nr:hypothetical protein [Streptomyces sp. NBC_01429]
MSAVSKGRWERARGVRESDKRPGSAAPPAAGRARDPLPPGRAHRQ